MNDERAVELREPAHLVSHRARLYWTARAVPAWLVIGVVEAVILFSSTPSAAVVVPVVAGTAVIALGHVLVMPQWRYRVHRWEITDTAAYTQTGWFTQERRIAPLARVQTVDTRRGPIEQLFGLSNVTITTASAKGPIVVHALDLAVAEQIVHWLTQRAQDGDGT